jgi:hypothetical protein
MTNGPRINLLTRAGNRDPIAGTPYHKHVRVRLEPAALEEAARAEAASKRMHAGAVT